MARRKPSGGALGAVLAALAALLKLLFAGGAGGGGDARGSRDGKRASAGATGLPAYAVDFAWPDRGDFEFEVVGESFHQPALADIAAALSVAQADTFDVCLVPYQNEHDPLAVAVVSGDRKMLGHLSRDDARSYRRRLSASKRAGKVGKCKAQLIGGYGLTSGKAANWGVVLDLKPFD